MSAAEVVELSRERRPRDLSAPRTLGESLDVVRAFAVLLSMDFVIRLRGFERFHRRVASWQRRRGPANSAAIARICHAVDSAAALYFKRAWCLQRSAATTYLLRRRGVPAELVFGVHKIPFYAHAWVEVDGEVVNDSALVRSHYSEIERC